MVLDFRSNRYRPASLGLIRQARLLLVVLAAGCLLLLIFDSRMRRAFQLLTSPGSNQPRVTGVNEPIDTTAPGADASAAELRQSSGKHIAESPSEHSAQQDHICGAKVPAELLQLISDTIRDDRRVVPSEWEAWLRVFAWLKSFALQHQLQLQAQPVTFVQLFRQPEHYRGCLVRVVGVARRAHRALPPRNDLGIEHYHQLWLSVDDHPQDPVAVWCLELPDEFPLGMSIEERVKLSGVFFKRMTYLAADGKWRRAPLILAAQVQWIRQPTLAPENPPPFGIVLIGGLLLSVVALLWIRASIRAQAAASSSRVSEEADPTEVAEQLRRLTQSGSIQQDQQQ